MRRSCTTRRSRCSSLKFNCFAATDTAVSLSGASTTPRNWPHLRMMATRQIRSGRPKPLVCIGSSRGAFGRGVRDMQKTMVTQSSRPSLTIAARCCKLKHLAGFGSRKSQGPRKSQGSGRAFEIPSRLNSPKKSNKRAEKAVSAFAGN